MVIIAPEVTIIYRCINSNVLFNITQRSQLPNFDLNPVVITISFTHEILNIYQQQKLL